MVGIPDAKRTRLVRLLGMLGSDFDGERANAGRMADEMVRELGLTWEQVVAADGTAGATSGGSAGRRSGSSEVHDHRAAASACLAGGWRWTDWECGFLDSVKWRWSLSEKQDRVLRKLC